MGRFKKRTVICTKRNGSQSLKGVPTNLASLYEMSPSTENGEFLLSAKLSASPLLALDRFWEKLL
jgi:hypothetical protein